MKRAITLIASLFLVISVAGAASAEMVNVGIMSIEKSDLNDIRELVTGAKTLDSNGAAPLAAQVDIGLMKMEAADLADIQDYVAGRKQVETTSVKAPANNNVNIGMLVMNKADLDDIANQTSWMREKFPGRQLLDGLYARQ